MNTRKPWWRISWLWWLLVIPLLWWALRNVPVGEILKIFSQLTVTQIFTLLAINGLVLGLMSLRWWLILRAQGYALPFRAIVSYRMAAFGVNYFTPGPQFGGEPLQVYLLHKRSSTPASIALASVTLDKLLEVLTNFSFLVLGAVVILVGEVFTGFTSPTLLPIASGMLFFPLGYFLALWSGKMPLSSITARLSTQLQSRKTIQTVKNTVYIFEAQIVHFCHTQPGAVGLSLLISFIALVAGIVEFWLSLRFLGAQLNFTQTIGVMTAARVAFLAPTPGGLGTLEASLVLAMRAVGFLPSVGISLSLLIRARDIAVGGFGLLWFGLTQRVRNKL